MAVRPLAVTSVETGVVVGTGVLVASPFERIVLVTAVNCAR
jgi:hypothetical protein